MPTLRAVAAALAASLTLTTIVASPSPAMAYAVPAAGASASATASSGTDLSQTRRERAGTVDRTAARPNRTVSGSTPTAPQSPQTTSKTLADGAPSVGDSATGSAASTASTATLPGAMHALPAHRLLDTRSGLGAPKAAVATGTSVSFQVAGREGVPTTGVGAVALTITAVSPTGAGFVTAYASGAPVPTASSLNYAAGDIAANLVVTRLSADGRAELRVGGSGSVQLLAEVVGWVEAGDATEPGAYAPLAPQRLLDTRAGTGAPKGILAGGATVTLPVAGRGGVPADVAGAVLLNVTATGGTAAGYLTVAPTLTGAVTTSSLNYSIGQVRANLVLVPLSEAGSVDVRVTSNGSVHAVADVVGWVRAGTSTAVGTLAAVAPARLLDTRTDGGGQIADHGWAEIAVTGVAGVPDAGVHAVLLNVTATRATAQGRVDVLPSASNLPTGSQVQFTKGRNDANLVLAPVSPDGWVDLLVQSSGSVDLVADVVGYVTGPTVDTIAPGPVTSLVVTQPTKNSISLTWENPTDADLSGVTIRRVVDGTTSDPFEGAVVAETTGTTFTDRNLTPGTTYGYSVWAHDSFPNVSEPVETSRTTTPLSWSAPAVVAPYVGSPSAVSCVTSSWCMAADRSGQVLTWNGTAWSAPKRAVSTDPTKDSDGFRALSCVSTAFCVGVVRGGVVTYRSGTWGPVVPVKTSTGVVVTMNSVDCASTTSCVAVGADDNWKGYAARFNGTTWTSTTGFGFATAQVECVSTTFCMAVGQDYNAGGWAARWNGSTWSSTKIEPNGSSTYDVSCTSTSFCMVTDGGGRSVRWNGTAWSAPVSFDSTNAFQGYVVSCTSTTFCVTVDTLRGARRWNGTSWSAATKLSTVEAWGIALSCVSSTCLGLDGRGRYDHYNGTSWTAMANVDPTSGGISDLSCTASTQCLATDMRGEAYRFDGNSWATPTTIGLFPSAASCASPTWCLAVTPEQRVSRTLSGSTWSLSAAAPPQLNDPDCPVAGWCVAFDQIGRVVTWNGSSWSAPRAVFPTDGSTPVVPVVDCVSTTFCVAYDRMVGFWSRWNGSTWSAAKDLNPSSNSGGVLSCVTTTMCVALDDDGTSFRYDGTTWRKLPASAGYYYAPYATDLACPSTTFCAALLRGGSIATFNGSTWNRMPQETGLFDVAARPADGAHHLECPAVYSCVVAGTVKVVKAS